MKGAFPPSSNDILKVQCTSPHEAYFFKVLEQSFARCLPTAVLPVKEIFLIVGWVHSMSPNSGELAVVRMLKTPFGKPAISASCGVSGTPQESRDSPWQGPMQRAASQEGL